MSVNNSMLQRLRHRLAPRLIALVVMASLITGGLVGMVLIQNSRTAIREDILEKNLATADLVAKFAANYIEGAETNLRQFAVSSSFLYAVLENELAEVEKHLAQFLEIDTRFDNVSVYDTKGIGWASGLMDKWQNRGGPVADREWFQQAVALKKPHLGIPTISRGTGHPVVSYAIPILDHEKEIHAVLVGGISLAALSDAVAGLRTSTFARASLMDARQHGIIITHSDPQRILTPVTGKNAASLQALSGERGCMEALNSSGVLDLAVFSPVHGLPWSVLILEPVETALMPVNSLTVKAGFCLGTVMLIAAALGSLLVRKITRPVRELVEGTEEISRGNLEYHIPVRNRDEIGQLAEAFNEMTIGLKHSRDERQQMEETLRVERDALEARVVERTQTLQDSERRLALLGRLRQELLGTDALPAKLKRITDGVVEILAADFARIWMIDQADLCDQGCCHATATEGPNVCRDRTLCLRLMASSGRYTHLDGDHRRVPLGCYKIGRVASGEELQFVTNEVTRDPLVPNHEWAESLGLVSFAGFRLLSAQGRPIGVLALCSQHPIQHQDEMHLRDLAYTTSQVILEGKAREALEKSEEKYRNLFANAQVGMYRTTLDGSAILDVNQKLADSLGYSIEEILSNPPTIHSADPNARNEMVRQLREEGVLTGHEMRMLNRHGEVRTGLISMKLYREEGYLEGTVVDITERKRSEELLRTSEETAHALLNGIPESAFLMEIDGTAVAVNETAALRLGRRSEEMVGKDLFTMLPPEVAETRREQMNQVIRTRQSVSFEDERSGRVMASWFSPVLDAHGQVARIAVIAFDVTDHKRAEEQLRNQYALLRAVMESSNALVFSLDRNYCYTSFNSKHAAVMKELYDADIEVGKNLLEYISGPGDRLKAKENLDCALNGDQVTVESWSGDRRFSISYFETSHNPIVTESGEVIGVTVFARDITERRRAEEQLRKSEERFRLSFEHASIGKSLTACDGRMEKVNHAFCEMLGYSEMELQAKGFSEVTHPDDLTESLECVRSLLAGEHQAYRMVKRYVRKDDSIVWADVSTILLRDFDGNPLHFVTHIVDITARRRAEEERMALERRLQQAQKAESLGRMASAIAHHFNNKLGAVLGNLELALIDLPPQATTRKYLTRPMNRGANPGRSR